MAKQENPRPRSMWLRLYTSLIDDPKAMRLPCTLFKSWVLTLCMAKDGDGILPPMDVIAFKLRLRPDVAKLHINALVKSGLIDRNDDQLIPHNWEHYQYESDTSVTRTRRYRERLNAVTGDVSVTSLRRPQRTENREQRTETPHTPQAVTPEVVSPPAPPDLPKPKPSPLTKLQQSWFADWWAEVWRRVDRGDAERRFAVQVRDPETFALVLAATKAQAPIIRQKEAQYQPYPSTWLNGKRWLDEAPVQAPGGFVGKRTAIDALREKYEREEAEKELPHAD